MDAFASALEVRDAVAGRQLTASQVARDSLERIKSSDLNAFLALDEEGAASATRAADARAIRKDAATGPLAGVPVALKDNIVTRGVATTAGSRILKGFVPPYDATVVHRLRDAGAVIVGKTNLDEFGMGSSSEGSAFGPTLNPWDPGRVPGGSSGGSAAAVAAGLVPIAYGTDTGGSIRQPAALCGVFGLKPTWGRVSRRGLIAYASSLDVIGPFARTTADLAAGLQAVAGADPLDSTSAAREVPDYGAVLERGVRGLKVGVPGEYFGEGLDPEVAAAVRAGIDRLAAAGAEIVEVSLPEPRHCLAAYYVIAPAEASSNLSRYDGVRYGVREEGRDLAETYARTRGKGFGSEVIRRIMLGTFALSAGYYDAYYGKAQQVRTRVRQAFDEVLTQCDVIATPTSPVTAPKLGEKSGDPLAMYLMDVYTIGANLAGLPAISVPCGLSAAGLPIGLQLMGRAFDEATLLQVSAAHEAAFGPAPRPGGQS